MSEQAMPAGERELRVDAERNRNRVLAAAREVFAEQGLQAPMAAVARHAGVGIATLFRRFPTKDELIAAAFTDKMRAYSLAIDEALADPDPWHGFCICVESICQMQADDRGFTDVLTVAFPSAAAFEAERACAVARFTELIDKAKATGRLRADFVHQDMIIVLMANAGVLAATTDAAQHTWRRLVAYLLQSFATEAAAPLPEPPTPDEVSRALLRQQTATNRA